MNPKETILSTISRSLLIFSNLKRNKSLFEVTLLPAFGGSRKRIIKYKC